MNDEPFSTNDELAEKIIDLLINTDPRDRIQILQIVKAQLAQLHLREADKHTKVSKEHKEYYELLKANL
jgi:hypothetical protein